MKAERDRVVSEARALSAQLYKWQPQQKFEQTTGALDALVDRLPVGKVKPHRERIFAPWREAHILTHIFEPLGCVRARLVVDQSSDRPDAEVDTGYSVLRIEITEAPEENWTPNALEEAVSDDGGPEDWRMRIASIPGLLREAGDRKRTKNYARQSFLLVYLNIKGTYGVGADDAKRHIRSFVEDFGGSFQGVYVLWNGRVYGPGLV